MKVAALITSATTLLAFLFSVDGFENITLLKKILLLIVVLSSLTTIVLEIVNYFRSKPKVYRSARKIRDYMYNWIKGSGRVVIFTRDMSWVNDDEMKDLLREKSKNDELIICVPQLNERAVELKKDGATIFEYRNLNYVPKSRFTIVNYGRGDAKVAVGKTIGLNQHIIEEYATGAHAFFNVANDLIEILNNYSKNGTNYSR